MAQLTQTAMKAREIISESLMTKYQKTISVMMDCFTWSDDKTRVCFKNEGLQYEDELHDIVYSYSDEVDNDSAYAWTWEAVEAIKEVLDSEDAADHESILTDDQVIDLLAPEADSVYTVDLLEWLAKSLSNYSALTAGEYSYMEVSNLTDAIMATQVQIKERIMLDVARLVLEVTE